MSKSECSGPTSPSLFFNSRRNILCLSNMLLFDYQDDLVILNMVRWGVIGYSHKCRFSRSQEIFLGDEITWASSHISCLSNWIIINNTYERITQTLSRGSLELMLDRDAIGTFYTQTMGYIYFNMVMKENKFLRIMESSRTWHPFRSPHTNTWVHFSYFLMDYKCSKSVLGGFCTL